MRRPVKPFVTEYKGSGRRGKEGRAEAEEIKPQATEGRSGGGGKASGRAGAQRDAGGDGRAPLPSRGRSRDGAAEDEPINSYEAAMRAADALFSPKSQGTSTSADKGAGKGADRDAAKDATRGMVKDAAKPSDPASGPIKSGKPSLAPRDAAAAVFAAAPAAQAEPVGRVLRALDEPEPALPEPMAEPVRRRGRRPGSADTTGPKVRKVRMRRSAASVEAPPTAPLALEEAPAAAPTATEAPSAVGAAAPMQRLMPEPAGGVEAGSSPSTPEPKRQRDRFPWIRTKLGPGEKWKRRLPKVAW